MLTLLHTICPIWTVLVWYPKQRALKRGRTKAGVSVSPRYNDFVCLAVLTLEVPLCLMLSLPHTCSRLPSLQVLRQPLRFLGFDAVLRLAPSLSPS